MPSPARRDRLRPLVLAACLVLVALVVPATANAHADLHSSDPANGATVPSPFSGPVVLTFTESLAVGSKADLYGPGHQLVASATIDAGTMTMTTSGALTPGDYTVEWVSIADDGDLLRGTVAFTVAPPASAPPSAAPSPTTSAVPSATATNPPSVAASLATSPEPSPAPPAEGAANGSDVLLPIIVALVVAAAGAFYLVRRNRPA